VAWFQRGVVAAARLPAADFVLNGFMMGTDDIRTCSTCWQLTWQAQRPSLQASSRWLAAAATASGDPPGLDPGFSLVLCSSVPACDALACEAPVRRDFSLRQKSTALVQQAFLAAGCGDPLLQKELLAGALAGCGGKVHWPEHVSPVLGPLAVHAAIVANNLLCNHKSVAASPPGVVPNDLTGACADSFASIESLIFPPADPNSIGKSASSKDIKSEERSGTVRVNSEEDAWILTASDLLVLEFLNHGLARLTGFAAQYQSAPVKNSIAPPPQWAKVCGLVGSAMLLASLPLGALLWEGFFILALPGAFLAGFGWFNFRSREFTLPPDDRFSWANDLRSVCTANGYGALSARFSACSILDHADHHFSGSLLADPARAAKMLKRLDPMPDAELVMPRLIRSLVQAVPASADSGDCPQVLWLAALGGHLLDDDGDSTGAAILSSLLLELLTRFGSSDLKAMGGPSMVAENSPLWMILATRGQLSGPAILPSANKSPDDDATEADGDVTPPAIKTEAGQSVSFPLVIARLSRRAASLRAHRLRWTCLEGRVIERTSHLIRTLWGHPPLVSRSWQSLLIRSLYEFLIQTLDRPQLPPDAGCTIHGLCLAVDQIRLARERSAVSGVVSLDPDLVKLCELPAFQALVVNCYVPIITVPRLSYSLPAVLDEFLLNMLWKLTPNGGASGASGSGGSAPGGPTGSAGFPKNPSAPRIGPEGTSSNPIPSGKDPKSVKPKKKRYR